MTLNDAVLRAPRLGSSRGRPAIVESSSRQQVETWLKAEGNGNCNNSQSLDPYLLCLERSIIAERAIPTIIPVAERLLRMP